MAKDEIKKLLENSKKAIDNDQENFAKSVKDDLTSFKKKTGDREDQHNFRIVVAPAHRTIRRSLVAAR